MEFPLIFAIVWALILMVGGGLLTSIGEWYRDLNKPSWQPPDWLFGPAWTVILGSAAYAFYICWDAAAAQNQQGLLIALFVANGVFHFLWSPLFFTVKRPDWAMVEVPFLWLSVLALTVFLREWSVFASWLIVPYLVWVSFAAILNWQIIKLNGPFNARAAS